MIFLQKILYRIKKFGKWDSKRKYFSLHNIIICYFIDSCESGDGGYRSFGIKKKHPLNA